MENFNFYAPTYFAFGKGNESGTIGGFVPLKEEDVKSIYRLML